MRLRLALLVIPLFVTIQFIRWSNDCEENYRLLNLKYPQVNKITFKDPIRNVRDSIIELKNLMVKLPKYEHYSVHYEIEKYPGRLNSFTLNWVHLVGFNIYKEDFDFHGYEVSVDSGENNWKHYVGANLRPFDTLSVAETIRFIELIRYLDGNNLNAAELYNGQISMSYCDSLRIAANTKFRTITLDTSYYGSMTHDIVDYREGIFLLERRSNN